MKLCLQRGRLCCLTFVCYSMTVVLPIDIIRSIIKHASPWTAKCMSFVCRSLLETPQHNDRHTRDDDEKKKELAPFLAGSAGCQRSWQNPSLTDFFHDDPDSDSAGICRPVGFMHCRSLTFCSISNYDE